MSKTILITGANGGIGMAIASMALENGFSNICLHYNNNRNHIDTFIKEHSNKGKSFLILKADISKDEEIKQMFKSIQNTFESLDALVNNAGTGFSSSKLEYFTAERLEKIFKINAIGYILCCKYAIKLMSIKYGYNGGKIVNISSAASRLGSPNEYIDYACTKGAVDTLTIGLSLELAEDKITVNCVRPGFIETNFHSLTGDKNRVKKLKDKIPLKRAGKATEVASATMWFLSEGANFTTGSFIEVAGGK